MHKVRIEDAQSQLAELTEEAAERIDVVIVHRNVSAPLRETSGIDGSGSAPDSGGRAEYHFAPVLR